MNEKKEYLTEENYEKGKKSLAKAIKIVLTIGLSISALLILSGIIVIATSGNSKNTEIKEETKEEVKEEVVYESKVRTEEEINNDIADVNNKISELEQKLPALKAEQDAEFRKGTGFTQRYYELDSQISTIEDEIRELKSKKNDLEYELDTREYDLEKEKLQQNLEHGFNDATQNMYDDFQNASQNIFNIFEDKTTSYAKKGLGGVLIFIGLGIIPPTLMISGILYFIYKRREIQIFTTQQSMPVTQETMEKMAPTVGNAAGTVAGTVAQSITKGIKDGLKDEEK